jgi:hypothetical protein
MSDPELRSICTIPAGSYVSQELWNLLMSEWCRNNFEKIPQARVEHLVAEYQPPEDPEE